MSEIDVSGGDADGIPQPLPVRVTGNAVIRALPNQAWTRKPERFKAVFRAPGTGQPPA